MSDTDPPLETLSRDAVTLLTKVILEVVAVLSTEAMTTFGHASKETTPCGVVTRGQHKVDSDENGNFENKFSIINPSLINES